MKKSRNNTIEYILYEIKEIIPSPPDWWVKRESYDEEGGLIDVFFYPVIGMANCLDDQGEKFVLPITNIPSGGVGFDITFEKSFFMPKAKVKIRYDDKYNEDGFYVTY